MGLTRGNKLEKWKVGKDGWGQSWMAKITGPQKVERENDITFEAMRCNSSLEESLLAVITAKVRAMPSCQEG